MLFASDQNRTTQGKEEEAAAAACPGSDVQNFLNLELVRNWFQRKTHHVQHQEEEEEEEEQQQQAS